MLMERLLEVSIYVQMLWLRSQQEEKSQEKNQKESKKEEEEIIRSGAKVLKGLSVLLSF